MDRPYVAGPRTRTTIPHKTSPPLYVRCVRNNATISWLTLSSRGLTPNIIKVAPSIAVSFYTFETVRDTLVRLQDVPEPDEI
jgi:hypothetical protein